ncbi:MAG: flagellar protein export ATPase FliI [Christensenellales bacterium]|jgi:flagellum-specific ATP synthase
MAVFANAERYRKALKDKEFYEFGGRISQVYGLTVEAVGLPCKMGDICRIYTDSKDNYVLAEVVGFKEKKVLLMPFGDLGGVGHNSFVVSDNRSLNVPVDRGFCGRVLDGLGNPMDGLGPVKPEAYYPIMNNPPNPMERRRITEQLTLGVKAIDAMLTLGKGQRVGIFAGSGVGKSTLLGMIARNTMADINVIVLIGERGREVKDFLEKDLQEEGLKRSVLIVATSDQPALVRLKSAMVGTAMAEYFRDQGMNVMLMMDSLTRFAMAQREIGMAVGEPPVSRGFPPSVYAILPKLLERAGMCSKGSITGLYTVLVEGDDMDEPIADTVRGILDGHIVLSRKLANSNHYPAIDVLQSVSRLMPDVMPEEYLTKVSYIRTVMSTYRDAQDLISIGAYKAGTNKNIDEAIEQIDSINALLKQQVGERFTFEETMELVSQIYDRRSV